MNWPDEKELRDWVRNEVLTEIYSLGLEYEWVGDPSTSTFGIKIDLTFHGYPMGDPIIIDFIGKTY